MILNNWKLKLSICVFLIKLIYLLLKTIIQNYVPLSLINILFSISLYFCNSWLIIHASSEFVLLYMTCVYVTGVEGLAPGYPVNLPHPPQPILRLFWQDSHHNYHMITNITQGSYSDIIYNLCDQTKMFYNFVLHLDTYNITFSTESILKG